MRPLAEHGLRGIPRMLRSLLGLRRTDVVELQVHYVHRHVAIMPGPLGQHDSVDTAMPFGAASITRTPAVRCCR